MNPVLTEITAALGWTLIHFLWQGAAIALLFWLASSVALRTNPAGRYAAASAAMLAMLITAGATFLVVYEAPAPTHRTLSIQGPELKVPPATTPARQSEVHTASVPTSEESPATTAGAPMNSETQIWQSTVALLWVLGVCLLLGRFALNWNGVRRLRRNATTLADHALAKQLVSLLARMRVRSSVELLASATARVPMVIGFVKPVILIPVSLLTNLDSRQLEAILAHELAHIRRHDYLTNLLQNLAEALLFFHPAAWWISSQIRKEREHCCDDIAAQHSGGALGYGRALMALEEQLLTTASPRLGLTATGGNLLQRIVRLAEPTPARRAAWPAALASCSIILLTVFGFLPLLTFAASEPDHQLSLESTNLFTPLLDDKTADEPSPPEETELSEDPAESKPDPIQSSTGIADSKDSAPALPIVGQQIPQDLESRSWGPPDPSGLSAAIDLKPWKQTYTLGETIERSYLIRNNSQRVIEFTIDHWLQDDTAGVRFTDILGRRYNHRSVIDDGATALVKVKLEPGHYLRIPTSNLFLFEIPSGEEGSLAGTYLDLPAGATVMPSATLHCRGIGEQATGQLTFVIQPAAEKKSALFQRANTKKKVIALTFMTGPHPKNTPALLEELKKRKVKATFFVVGSNVDRYPEIIAQIAKDGHEIGNNSMNHKNFRKLSNEQMLEEVKACHAAISQASGVKAHLLRPPYGSLSDAQRQLIAKELGYRSVLWSIDPGDWKRPGPQVVADFIIKHAHPGGIVALHDLHKPTITAVPLALDGLVAKGYSFATVSELIALDEGGAK